MRSDQPLAEALRATLRECAQKLKKRLRKAAKGDPEAVHEARTTLRRLQQCLVVAGRTVFDPDTAGEMGRRLHRVEKLLGPTRDADVLLRGLRGWMTHSRSPVRAGIRPLIVIVARRRRRMAGELAGELQRGRVRHLTRDIRRLMRKDRISATPVTAPGGGAKPWVVGGFVAEETWHGYEEVLALESQGRSSEARIVHKLRSACRSFRYRLELFDGALPKEGASVIATLRALQKRLGELHDRAVAVKTTEKLISGGKLRRTEAVDAYLESRRDTRARLRVELGSAWRRLTVPALRDAIAGVARKGSFNVGSSGSRVHGTGSPDARTRRGTRKGANASGP
jgi:CHAD domain-containing protein